jgi:hypothetical protein
MAGETKGAEAVREEAKVRPAERTLTLPNLLPLQAGAPGCTAGGNCGMPPGAGQPDFGHRPHQARSPTRAETS